MTDIVTLSQLEAVFEHISFDVHDGATATQFLKDKKSKKDPSNRFLAWMIQLGALPDDPKLWPLTLFHLIRNYRSQLAYYLKTPKSTIPDYIETKAVEEIRADISRAIVWFEGLIDNVGLTETEAKRLIANMNDAQTSVTRIMCIMIHESPQFHYLQGYDRFALISFSIALAFSYKINLDIIEAEALSIVLLRHLVALSEVASFLQMQSFVIKYFSELDAYLKGTNPEIMNCLINQTGGCASVNFASNWVGVLFADSHDYQSLLLLWDHIVLHKNRFKAFFNALVAAHLYQIDYIGQDPFELLQEIQYYKGWDVVKVITDAERIITKPVLTKQSPTSFTHCWL